MFGDAERNEKLLNTPIAGDVINEYSKATTGFDLKKLYKKYGKGSKNNNTNGNNGGGIFKMIILSGIGCLGSVMMFIMPMILTFSLLIMLTINATNILRKAQQMVEKLGEVVEEIIDDNIGIASASNIVRKVLTGTDNPRPSSQSWGEDTISCEGGCRCIKKTKTTKTYKENSIRFSNWTIQDPNIAYVDTDYSKFIKRDCVKQGDNDGTHKLFEYKISNFKEKQNITFESYQDTDNGNSITETKLYVKNIPTRLENWKDNPDLDIGGYATLYTIDGRIPCAFAPITRVPNGSQGQANLIKARTVFNDGSSWDGTENSFHGLNFGLQALPVGSYYDVVFEHNETKQQVVVPFILADEKGIHNDLYDESSNSGLYGQYTDQRWGQCREKVTFAEDRVLKYQGKLYDVVYMAEAVTNQAEIPSNPKSASYNYMMYNIKVGGTFEMKNQKELHDNEVVSLTHGYARLKVVLVVEKDAEIYYCSENDERSFYGHTALELMYIRRHDALPAGYSYSPNLIVQQFLIAGNKDGRSKDGKNERVDWSIVGVRAYNKQYEPSNPTWFKDQLAKMETKKIEDNNVVVDFCGTSCKCSICTKIAN